ncbi:MAG: HAD hydrolase-like protein, partial [bacterium]|nr:HAD hydrolase-like protein [bacterium]
MVALLQAVIFDMDGVIAETEGDGHRVAFNETFRRNEIKAEWDQETYAELLKIPAGKDRLRHYILQNALLPEEGLEDRIIDLLRQKTVIFQDLVKSGQIPARPGVRDFIQSLFKANLKVALATTGSEKAAHTLLISLLGK